MNSLAKYLVEQIEGKTIAVFGGGFKPPTKGHFSVVKQALKQNPEIEEFRVYVGTGERDGISQSQSTMIWNIYAKYLPFKVEIIPSEKAPIRAIYNTAKDNPQSKVLWVIGAREGNEDDFKDIASRTTSVNKYPNLELRTIVSKDGISGTAARNALNQTPEKFTSFLPDELSDEEKQEVVNILSSAPLNENVENIDYKKKIVEFTKHLVDQGENIQPLPKVIFKHDEQEAEDFFGKTAYYQPNTQTIVLYVKDRHPKDIVRSFSHEMVHHIQNLENRLGAVTTTDTNEDDNLDKIEREAYLDGNMTFRNWSDTYVGNQMKESNENLFSKNIQESIISDIREYGNLPEYKIDLNDTYDYNPSNNFFEFYDDINNVDVIAKVKSLSKDITEFKFYPIKDGKSLGFIKLSKSNPKIMNTIFKIFLNEVLSKYDKILIQPSDYTRYRLFRAMLSNNLDKKDYKINTNDNPIGQSSLFIQKPTTNELEEKTKDPFGLTAYAAELGRLREDEGEYKLYLDMDGVVADFDRRFRELSGMAPKEFENKHGKNKFWDFIDEGDNKIKFWVGIPPMPGAQELVSFINSNFDYEMLTAPSIKKQSFTGKRLWIRNWTNKGLFPSKPEINFKSAKNKKDFAAPNHILVDDKPSTIDAWNAAGGIGILFQSAEQVINDLQQYVKKGV